MAMSGRVPGFLPSTSGLRFVNSFPQGIADATIPVPPFGSITFGDASNGVCGGMVYVVMDLFHAQPRLLPPTATDPPAGGTSLMNYITARLMDSFALPFGLQSNGFRYIDLMSAEDEDPGGLFAPISRQMCETEWPAIKADIDAGRPVPIGLLGGIKVGTFDIAAKEQQLHQCHCVLAYAYDVDDASNLTLHVYDPNDPLADDSTIGISLLDPGRAKSVSTPRISANIAGSITFRAFFKHHHYAVVTPNTGISPGPVGGPTGMTVQDDWRWCNKCQSIFYGGGVAISRCPTGGAHSTPAQSGSFNYSITFNALSTANQQDGWRWCSACQNLFYGGGLASSHCTAGGTHTAPLQSGSGDYSLAHTVPGDAQHQTDWRWCSKCQSLFYGGGVAASSCPAGGTHSSLANSGSADYALRHELAPPAPSTWTSLGGLFKSGPAVASWGPNRLDVFARGNDDGLWRNSSSGSGWSGWSQLHPHAITSDPAAVSWGPNRIDIIARGPNGQMYAMNFNGSQWSGWGALGGQFTSGPAVASWAPNRLDVFGRGLDNALYTCSWNGGWSNWSRLSPDHIASDPAAVSWGPNRIDVFARGMDRQMYQMFFDGAQWSGWIPLGGLFTSGPAVASWEANRLDVFGRGDDNALYTNSYAGSGWSGWSQVAANPIDSDPAAVSWEPKRIDVFARGTDGQMHTMTHDGA